MLEPDGIRATSSEAAYWRRRVHPGMEPAHLGRLLAVSRPSARSASGCSNPTDQSWSRRATRRLGYGPDHLRPAARAPRRAAPGRDRRRVSSATAGCAAGAGSGPARGSCRSSSIVAVALVLRAITLGAQSFWFDEVLTAIGAQSFAWVLYSAQIFGHPPLQYLVAWAAGGAAATEAAVRAPFVAAGVAAVVVMALLGRRLAGPATGLLAAGLLAVSPYHVELSQLARPYALVLCWWPCRGWPSSGRSIGRDRRRLARVLGHRRAGVLHPLSRRDGHRGPGDRGRGLGRPSPGGRAARAGLVRGRRGSCWRPGWRCSARWPGPSWTTARSRRARSTTSCPRPAARADRLGADRACHRRALPARPVGSSAAPGGRPRRRALADAAHRRALGRQSRAGAGRATLRLRAADGDAPHRPRARERRAAVEAAVSRSASSLGGRPGAGWRRGSRSRSRS